MKEHKLTIEQSRLIQRHHDGDLVGEELEQARELLAGRADARELVDALDEVQVAARGAEQAAWEAADPAAADVVAQTATELADGALDRDLLGALIERAHDGEADDFELASLDDMREEDPVIAEYFSTLDVMNKGTKAAVEEATADVDFSGFWGALSERLELEESSEQAPAGEVVEFPGRHKPSTSERPAFDADNHRVMLYRHYDGEASEDEVAQVLAWAEIDPTVSETIGALEELTLATKVAIEVAEERQDLSRIWSGVAAEIGKDSGVVSLDRRRAEREQERERTWIDRHRREISVAMLAALVTIVGAWMFGGFGTTERVIVEKTVVIVDSVEYESGASVMVSGPMQAASMEIESEEEADEAEATPTIIWLIDPEEEPSGDSGSDQGDEDAPDAGSSKLGQPI